MISLLPRRIRKSRIYPPPGIRDATLPEGRDFLMWVGFTPALPHKNKQLCLISAELNLFLRQQESSGFYGAVGQAGDESAHRLSSFRF